MKIALAALVMMSAVSASATTVQNENAQVRVGRVVQTVVLVQKPGLQVSVVVEDLGGSTDVSPTQRAYLTIYSKGEMFSTDAAFKIDDMFAFKGARRVGGGLYEVQALLTDGVQPFDKVRTIKIDARKAVTAIQSVRCDDFDCDASTNFTSTVEITK